MYLSNTLQIWVNTSCVLIIEKLITRLGVQYEVCILSASLVYATCHRFCNKSQECPFMF